MTNAVIGGIIGLLLGLAFCFWKQIKAVAQNKGKIGAAGDVIGSVGNLLNEFGVKL